MKALEVLENEILPLDILAFSWEVPTEPKAKIDHIAHIIAKIEEKIGSMQQLEDNIKSDKLKLELIVKAAKDSLKDEMTNEGLCEISGNLIKYVVYNSNPSLVIIDESLIPDKYKTSTVTNKVDKNKIKEDLKKGIIVAGVSIETEKNIRITVK